MKKGLHILISAIVLVIVILLLILLSTRSAESRSQLTCSEIEVEIIDGDRLGFVNKEDIKHTIQSQYGSITGQRLETIDLRLIEEILDGKSAVLKSQAYTTLDGILHVEIIQREPILLFKTSNGGYYADETGYIFPLIEGYEADITLVEGENPMNIKQGFKGTPESEKEKKWLTDLVSMMQYLKNDKTWNNAFKTIKSEKNGNITLYPKVGKERFLFGRPEDVREKFDKMGKYYQYIAPTQEEGYYTIVNVKYDGQIVCRRK